MKNIIILSILCLTIVYPLKSQVVVTGHVTAEIVDAAGISSACVNELTFSRSQCLEEQRDSDPVLLGDFFVHSGSDVTWDIVVKPASLADSNGECVTLDTSLKKCDAHTGETPVEPLHTDADQTLQLNGDINLLREKQSGLYQGSYTIILAYN